MGNYSWYRIILDIPSNLGHIVPVPVVVQPGFGIIILAGQAEVQFQAVFIEVHGVAKGRIGGAPDHVGSGVCRDQRLSQMPCQYKVLVDFQLLVAGSQNEDQTSGGDYRHCFFDSLLFSEKYDTKAGKKKQGQTNHARGIFHHRARGHGAAAAAGFLGIIIVQHAHQAAFRPNVFLDHVPFRGAGVVHQTIFGDQLPVGVIDIVEFAGVGLFGNAAIFSVVGLGSDLGEKQL